VRGAILLKRGRPLRPELKEANDDKDLEAGSQWCRVPERWRREALERGVVWQRG